MPAAMSWRMMRVVFRGPSSVETLPYMPEKTYAMASPAVMSRAKSFCTPL